MRSRRRGSGRAGDTLVHGLPLFHVHGLILGVLGPLRVGSRLIHTGKPTPQAYAEAQGTLYFGVPTVWSRVVEDEEAARALSGGAAAGVRKRPVAGAGVRTAARADRSDPPDRAVRDERDDADVEHPRRRGNVVPDGWGRRCAECRPGCGTSTVPGCRTMARASEYCRFAGRCCSTATSTAPPTRPRNHEPTTAGS